MWMRAGRDGTVVVDEKHSITSSNYPNGLRVYNRMEIEVFCSIGRPFDFPKWRRGLVIPATGVKNVYWCFPTDCKYDDVEADLDRVGRWHTQSVDAHPDNPHWLDLVDPLLTTYWRRERDSKIFISAVHCVQGQRAEVVTLLRLIIFMVMMVGCGIEVQGGSDFVKALSIALEYLWFISAY